MDSYAYDIIGKELDEIEFDTILEGSNDRFYIKPTFTYHISGERVPTYGIFNRATNICEADTKQYESAKEWVVALTAIANGEMDTGPVVVPMTEGGQTH